MKDSTTTRTSVVTGKGLSSIRSAFNDLPVIRMAGQQLLVNCIDFRRYFRDKLTDCWSSSSNDLVA